MLDKSQLSQTVSQPNMDEQEIARFDALASSWWDPKGHYKTSLAFNAVRVDYIVSTIKHHFKPHGAADKLLDGLSVLDVGSGGGLICEPLAKRGAEVTGIDASGVSVEVARRHAARSNLAISYHHTLASQWAASGHQYDIVINAEVVEHVPCQEQLIKECASMVKPGGLLILATLNRTVRSYFVAIVGAEYIMRYLPIGTHDWTKFVKPAELERWLSGAFVRQHITGFALNPLNGVWRASSSQAVNYMASFKHSA
ncbi:bifunctional 2-polyprenyl-6-hydroxyphenol methylase/3-demethylubiquinol 3-O-methyltransferase UbiG [Alteromonas sp. C1M14]|uniref:bifunctional 2-polyprenyl-6-hydroxyphenol methylase/3-demethylubiquinol 3-O-methyltransferase UbiG n=1 Tax=Alteromonas sp. C1M14 TaxID=2841567 RepID=UPI001C085496|nr:bifunctional 2-polyprenyl-6-hydroxyphenol methylase/3-demethylubiquinol 3-O-methyltransferase UbiG [Alteromonas sp. C1M14]MBU2980145.1 bifunctional 2-polyprenyl-6-hydroxyphenol methylase/3-demethylubiquinol 3-O-methyltransferase UbiG [Alteromonas sp. C1M14]